MRVLMLGIVLAIATVVPTTSSADDQQIAEFIKTKLLEEKQRGNLFGFNVDMRVDRGTVWFKGFVSNRSQELMILRTAQLAGHLGVVQVVDDIDVNQSFAETTVAPPVRQEVRQQQAVMTAIPNGQQSLQMPNQPMMQQPQMQQQMQPQMLQPMMQPQMQQQFQPQPMQQQQMQPQMMQQQPMQQQPMHSQMTQQQWTQLQQLMQQQMMQQPNVQQPNVQQPNVQQPGSQGMQQFAPAAGQFAPAEQIAPPAPHRAEMPMLRQIRPDMETAAQPVVYQEPAYVPEMDRATAADQQPADYDPSFQQNLMNPVGDIPQAQYQQPAANQAAPVSIRPAVNAPVHLVSTNSQPLPFARAASAAQCGPDGGCGMMQGYPSGDGGMMQGCPSGDCGMMSGGPIPGGGFGGGFGGADGGGFAGGDGISSDSANLPGYAWPSYAAHPNYGAVSYPKQYSPSAWPYIGPFYPYPQVPLGWRKVALEWDDGWWFLDFHDKN